ncbi:cell wall hydrolase [Brevibacillus antibioticus]|uniref:Cell wall hydrolase n=1 Tax=Brevibacillus antibioticus TaxID=2570228 RepID=A0A4V5TIR3_9BACL|nr:cell wall hydrolase [Brevibacillus antibioticus]TKI56253.1 cell wall hydrolase [Brevibacillus antibioticus]
MAYGEPLKRKSQLEDCSSTDLLARIIYAEAEGESEEGKRGVAFVIKNRKDRDSREFGGNTYKGVILKKSQFSAVDRDEMLQPDTSSRSWKDSLDIAKNMSKKDNPIGDCLWFNADWMWEDQYDRVENTYTFPDGSKVHRVVEMHEIGKHVFFRVKGY